jgi:hypothetical protein
LASASALRLALLVLALALAMAYVPPGHTPAPVTNKHRPHLVSTLPPTGPGTGQVQQPLGIDPSADRGGEHLGVGVFGAPTSGLGPPVPPPPQPLSPYLSSPPPTCIPTHSVSSQASQADAGAASGKAGKNQAKEIRAKIRDTVGRTS